MERVRVAVVGTGRWGINHVRVFTAEPRCEVVWVCDTATSGLERACAIASGANSTASYAEVLADESLDAVVLATPAVSHAEQAVQALEAGKHVFVEKPMALTVADAERVRDAAERAGRVVLVGHLMLYHSVFERVHELLASGELGELYYLYASRVNLGRLRHDENALWSFAPHDVSMIDFLLREEPVSVTARGECYLQKGIEDVVFMTVKYAGGQMAHVHLSWLDPHKERKLTIVGSKKMAVFDDVSPEKLRVYDKGYDTPPAFDSFEQYLTIRHGGCSIPHVPMREPLAMESRHFIECIADGATPRTGVESAVRVVKILAAAQQSLEQDGAPAYLTRD